ncbi:hypothetical protein RRG08_007929 [Elysia crispata]|uniref:Uncharacterized protein n=1 Tax=Elysia crispata TaxID=231223 RepID=A0AAE0ZQ76_9GAST|nr:hypothetical protein RRG08_007929 [Elysia crispata]
MVTANTTPLAGYHGGEYGHGKYHTFNRLSRRRLPTSLSEEDNFIEVVISGLRLTPESIQLAQLIPEWLVPAQLSIIDLTSRAKSRHGVWSLSGQ